MRLARLLRLFATVGILFNLFLKSNNWSNAPFPSSTTTPADNKYVVFSTTLESFARPENYDYLAPLIALNWLVMGFHPIIIVVASNSTLHQKAKEEFDKILPSEDAYFFVPIVAPLEISIYVAQMSRLFGAALVPEISDDSYLRVTDADMMIMDPKPFSQRSANISIYNGECCLRKIGLKEGRLTCSHYPMHSVGMTFGTWRKLFTLKDNEDLVSQFLDISHEYFGSRNYAFGVKHGGRGWQMDQIYLGCTIDRATQEGASLELAPGPQSRKDHATGDIRSDYTDIHLAGFELKRNHEWMKRFVNETGVLDGRNLKKYLDYTASWARSRNIILSNV